MWLIEEIVEFLAEGFLENIIKYFVGTISESNNIKAITDILHKSFITVANEFGYSIEIVPSFPAFIKENTIEDEMKKGLKMFVYKLRNKEIGCIGYVKETDELYKIKRLAVLPEYRHKGLGKKLLKNMETIIKNFDGKIIETHIVNNNTILKAWYLRNGYKEKNIEYINSLLFKVCILQKII
jgi:ribosomal protein S18 acetylase RimI-like enzyme